MKKILAILAWAAASALSAAPSAYDSSTAGQQGVVLVVNRNVPAGLELARYYASRRGVPAERVLALDLPTAESMSRRDYERLLRDPLLAALREQKLVEQVRREEDKVGAHESGWTTVRSEVRYLVLFHGVPLRVEDSKPWPLDKVARLVNQGYQRDEAAVDSELCLVLQDGYELRSRVANPYYNQFRWEQPAGGGVLLMVGRLDAPEPGLVKGMIDQALYAERYGLQGRVYIDQRDLHNDEYRMGDYWLEEAGQRLAREGYDLSLERTDAVFGDRYPMDEAAIYLGWYTEQVTGPFARTNFAFRPGALAYHNHSGNARSLRSATQNWTGPLLARGAAISMGAVAEPFLNYTPHLPIVIDRLCQGAPWADAVYLSMAALSWQTTVLGDPLYRPFSVPLDEQIKRLEEAGDEGVAWAYARKAQQYVREGRLHLALRYLRERLKAKDSTVLREKLADLYALNELYDDAAINYELALKRSPSAETAVRVGVRYLSLLEALGKKEQAARVNAELRERWSDSLFLDALPRVGP